MVLLKQDGENINIQQNAYTKMLENAKQPGLRTHVKK
jgi:hypothetical protein